MPTYLFQVDACIARRVAQSEKLDFIGDQERALHRNLLSYKRGCAAALKRPWDMWPMLSCTVDAASIKGLPLSVGVFVLPSNTAWIAFPPVELL